MTRPLRIGGGSAFVNDRLDAALELIEHGRIDVLMVETRTERTLAMLQAARRRAARHFAAVVHGPVARYGLRRLFALHFVLERALAGGVNDSLALDTHGKSRSSLLLDMAIPVPDDHRTARR